MIEEKMSKKLKRKALSRGYKDESLSGLLIAENSKNITWR